MKDAALLERPAPRGAKRAQRLAEHIVEVISDSGEGAQRCGQSLAAIAARSGNGIWTVEIIPAEIQPPARSIAGASGIRIRIGSQRVTNGGDETDLVVAFNEQVLLGRVRAGELKPGATILLESMWAEHRDPVIVKSYTDTVAALKEAGYRLYEVPLERECRALMSDARRGKNMFVLGMLCSIYSLDLQLGREQIALTFGKKDQKVIDSNVRLLEAGYAWGEANLDFKYEIPAQKAKVPQIVVNGNTAIALGVLASGMDICAMYPITPATSASHYLSDVFEKVGGIVHQAEDEIAACAFAIGASYAGRCAVTITSGPGYSLKQEGIGLAVMAEIPLVVVNVQRGGPSTGQPTKVEQADLLTAIYGSHGDAPKVVMAVTSIEDCFYSMITARKIAETFNTVVVVLSDASLATAQQPFPRPNLSEDFIKQTAERLNLNFIPEGKGDLKKTFGPEDIFHYAYAIFHSPTYRQRYAEFLKIDFPRLPVTSDRKLFARLASKGAELVGLHLLKSPVLDDYITSYPIAGDHTVGRILYDKKRVWINETQYFGGVPENVWEFTIGGYQVCEKWLKDRKGRQLDSDDLVHYQRMIVAIKETLRLMEEIDRIIPGWPIE